MIKHIKEIWLQFKNKEELITREPEVYQISHLYEGDFELVFYTVSPKAIKKLKKFTAKEAAQEFIQLLGERNVKIIERETEEYIPPELEPEPLERIAEALEGIECKLGFISDSLDELTECISSGPRGKLFCITGNVTTYEG